MVWPALIGAAAGLAGAALSNRANRSQAESQEATQREFAQMGIRWKVADAKAAGIHPLYALGASTHSYSPIAIQDQLGPAMASAGQDVSRAVYATRTQAEREQSARLAAEQFRISERRAEADHSARLALSAAELEGRALNNELLRQQLRRAGAAGTGPAMPHAVRPVPQLDAVEIKPSAQFSRDPEVAGREASRGGGKPAMVPYRVGGNRMGFTLDVPSSEFGEGLEGGGPAAWLLGAMGIGGHYLGKGMDWLTDNYGGRELQRRTYQFLQNQGVYPRRKGM